jgi:hypothetical protein
MIDMPLSRAPPRHHFSSHVCKVGGSQGRCAIFVCPVWPSAVDAWSRAIELGSQLIITALGWQPGSGKGIEYASLCFCLCNCAPTVTIVIPTRLWNLCSAGRRADPIGKLKA